MSNEHSREVTAAAIARAESGDAAAKDALFSALYDELHRLAQSHLRRSGGALTISATTLLHEAYLELAGGQASFPTAIAFSATPRGRCGALSSITFATAAPRNAVVT